MWCAYTTQFAHSHSHPGAVTCDMFLFLFRRVERKEKKYSFIFPKSFFPKSFFFGAEYGGSDWASVHVTCHRPCIHQHHQIIIKVRLRSKKNGCLVVPMQSLCPFAPGADPVVAYRTLLGADTKPLHNEKHVHARVRLRVCPPSPLLAGRKETRVKDGRTCYRSGTLSCRTR